ncbi:MAG: hypothetical protein ACTHOC_10940 [Luteimonas sp.]|jgi:hypothetical protein
MSSANRFLSIYAGVLTLVFVGGAVYGNGKDGGIQDEITVQRINIVEPDGTPRMVISNHAKLPGVLVHGRENPLDRPQAGLIFLNDEGSEIGGLIFGGRKDKDGKVRDSGGSLSFDRYEANQVVQLLGVDDAEDRMAGLSISDSPSGNDVRRRIWLGRGDDGAATLALLDGAGRKRIVMAVAEDGGSRISVLDASGKTVRELLP